MNLSFPNILYIQYKTRYPGNFGQNISCYGISEKADSWVVLIYHLWSNEECFYGGKANICWWFWLLVIGNGWLSSPICAMMEVCIYLQNSIFSRGENVLTEQADSLAVSPATIYQMLSFWSDLIFCHFGGEIFVRMESFYQGKFFIEMCKVSL